MADGDRAGDAEGDEGERERRPYRWRRGTARGQIGFQRGELVGEDGGVGALEPLLELVDAQPSRGGMSAEALCGVRALAVADADFRHAIKIRRLIVRLQGTMPAMNLPPIGLRLARTARTVSQAFERAMADAGGSASMWQVLLLVKTQQWGNQSQMAEALGITGATLTHHLNAMEAQGLLTRRRDPEDRRVHQVALTEAGEALFEKLRIAAVAFDKRLRTGLSDERLAEFAEVLAALRANVEAQGFARLPASFPGDEDDQPARSRQRASAIKS